MRTVFRNSEIPGRIHAMQSFLSTGRLPDGTRVWSGHSGPATSFGHLPTMYYAPVREAVYVVYSYGTPIAWVTENEDRSSREPYVYHVPDIGYSPTTGQHQMECRAAWEEALRRQGTFLRWPGRNRRTVRVPGNATVYGRERRVRSGGMDGVRPGEVVGRTSAYADMGDDASHMDARGSSQDGYGPWERPGDWGWHSPAHP
jgi:hypothetical protein